MVIDRWVDMEMGFVYLEEFYLFCLVLKEKKLNFMRCYR